MSLPTRKIGSTPVSAIGYGAMGLSAYYGPTQPDEERFEVQNCWSLTHLSNQLICSLQVLDAAYERGCRFWDSSDIYGDSEDLIGKWFVLLFSRRLPFCRDTNS